jgi:hypothetical protein
MNLVLLDLEARPCDIFWRVVLDPLNRVLDTSGEVTPFFPREPRIEHVGASREKYAIFSYVDAAIIEPQLDGGCALEGEELAATHLLTYAASLAEGFPSAKPTRNVPVIP